jgi:type II secretory pathway pseudopilin PulG
MLRRVHGFALLDLLFVCGIIGVLSGIALPRLLTAKQAAGAAAAIGSIRAINSAELTYAITCGNGFYAPKLTTLGVPPPGSQEPFIAASLSSGDTVIRSGYLIRVTAAPYTGAPPTCNGLDPDSAGQGFRAAADPSEPSNFRHFATNASNTIYEDTSSLFASIPEIGEPASGHPIH